MDDGAKEDPAPCKGPNFLGKAGWVKRATGRLFAGYKDHFIQVEKTEVLVYQDQDLQNCLEKIDLENYDKCEELKSTFKKKHRLVLIRSAKSGRKVLDVKFQVQSSEEKEAWIEALRDAINRAKNKVFDEVKIDESCNLEHVTRTRPKGNQNRRPPSRIHLKQATSAPSKDVLDLDTVPDETLPNGTHCSHWDAPPKEAIHVGIPLSQTIEATEKPEGIEEEAEGEPELQPEPKAVPDDEPGTAGCHKKKVLKPPMPPSKDAKPCVLFVEETAVETGPDSKKSDPPATIPNNHTPKAHPPTPPPKEKKPSHPAVEGDQQDRVVPGDDEPAPSPVGGHDSERASGSSSEEESGETRSSDVNRLSNSRSATPTESLSVNSSPLLTAKVQAEESGPPGTDHREDEETPPTEGQEPTALLPVATATETGLPDVLLTVPVNDGFSPSPALCLFEGGGEGRREEEKSVDSGQDSDDDSEDTLGGSTFALRGSHAVLEVLCDEENLQIGTKLGKAVAAWGSHVPSQELPPQCSEKPSKVWSASSGDLTSESSARIPERKRSRAAASCDDVTNLSAGSPLEMEETHLPFQPASPSQDDEGSPAEATEELKMGDPLLRGVKNLEPAQNSGYRKSW